MAEVIANTVANLTAAKAIITSSPEMTAEAAIAHAVWGDNADNVVSVRNCNLQRHASKAFKAAGGIEGTRTDILAAFDRAIAAAQA